MRTDEKCTGEGNLGRGEMWHNKIIPQLAMVFKDRSQGMQGAEPLEQPLGKKNKFLRTSCFNFEPCFTGE